MVFWEFFCVPETAHKVQQLLCREQSSVLLPPVLIFVHICFTRMSQKDVNSYQFLTSGLLSDLLAVQQVWKPAYQPGPLTLTEFAVQLYHRIRTDADTDTVSVGSQEQCIPTGLLWKWIFTAFYADLGHCWVDGWIPSFFSVLGLSHPTDRCSGNCL